MSDKSLFHYRRLPARLDVNQTAELLGFLPHEIPVLVRAGLLKPLGNPVCNARKFYSCVEIEELARSRAWLDKATRAVGKYAHEKNRNGIEKEFEVVG